MCRRPGFGASSCNHHERKRSRCAWERRTLILPLAPRLETPPRIARVDEEVAEGCSPLYRPSRNREGHPLPRGGEGGAGPPALSPLGQPSALRLNRMLDEAKRASEMPWDARTARSYESAFPHFANWLPAEEAAQLSAAFREELDRLKDR